MFNFTVKLFTYIVYNPYIINGKHLGLISNSPERVGPSGIETSASPSSVGLLGLGAVTSQAGFSNLKQTPKLCYFCDSNVNILHKC